MGVFARGGRNLSQDAMAALGPGAHPRISIKGGRFTLLDAAGAKYPWPMLALPVVIVGANPKVSKIFYNEKFDPDNPIPPVCFSDNGVAPSALAGEPQARTCMECQWYGWGTAISEVSGKKTKACDDRKKLAVLVPGDTAQQCYELQIPPTSLKNLNTYSAMIASMTVPGGGRNADLPDVVTIVSFSVDNPFMLEFKHWSWIDSVGPDFKLCWDATGQPRLAPDNGDAFGAFIDDLWEGDTVDKVVNIDDKPWHGAAMGAIGAAPQAYLEAQPQGGALQRGSQPQVAHQPAQQPGPAAPFAPPPGAQAQQPAQAVAPKSTRGGARTGAGRKPSKEPVVTAPATGPAFAQTAPQPSQPAGPAFAQPSQPASPAFAKAAGPAFAQGAPDAGDIPAFLRRDAGNNVPGNGAAPLQEAKAPGPEMADAVNRAFSMNTTRN